MMYGTRDHESATPHAGLLKLLCAVVFTAALIAIPALLPSTSGAFTASVRNTANTAKVMPFLTCKQALTRDAGGIFAYQLNTTNPVNLVDGRTGTAATTNVAPAPGATGCKHDDGGALTFTRPSVVSNTNVSTVRYNVTVPAPSTYTQEVWFRATSPARGSLMTLAKDPAYSTSKNVRRDRALYIGESGKLTMANYIPSRGGFETIQTAGQVSPGVWHHVIATRDAAGGTSHLYLDGALVGTTAATGTLDDYSPAYWRMGCATLVSWPDASTGTGTDCFDGQIAFVAAYNRAFTQQDVTNHYRAGTW